MSNKTRLELDNENAYLRQAVITLSLAMQAVVHNAESGRFQVLVMDDGAPHPANLENGKAALEYANKCLELTL